MNALTEVRMAQINMAVNVNLTLFVACMGGFFWDNLGEDDKKFKFIINIFFAVGGVFSAAGFMIGFVTHSRDYLTADNYKVLRGQIIACPCIAMLAMFGAMLVMFFTTTERATA